MIPIAVAALSDKGARMVNEDSYNFSTFHSISCFIVADGVGGQGRGEVASKAVVTSILSSFSERPSMDRQLLENGLEAAREALGRERSVHAEAMHMDSTVVCMLLDTESRRVLWLQLGDSRVYLFRNNRAHLLTHDHSVLQSLVDAGMYKGEIRGAEERFRLYASVGAEMTPPDTFSPDALEVCEGDVFLLCSDGFWEVVDEASMEANLIRSQNPNQWLNSLFAEGKTTQTGWDDNATAMAVWLGCKDETTCVGGGGRESGDG